MYVSCWMDSARRLGGCAERIPFFASAPPVVSGKSSPCPMRLLDGSSSGSRRAASDERSPCRYRCRSWRELSPDDLAADALMESLGQVVRHELLHHVPQVSLAEEDEFVQALVLDRLHEPLGVRIAVRTARWDLHALHAPRPQNRGECLREHRISIVDQVLRAPKKPVDRIGQVAGYLFHPFPTGIDLYPDDLDGAALDLDDEEHHVPDRPRNPQGFHAEEIAGVERLPVHLHELLPRPLLFPLRRWLDASLRPDVGHRRPSDLDLQSGSKRVADLRVAPAEIGQRHIDHKFPDVLPLARPADPASRAIVLPRAQLSEPRQERRRLHDLAVLPPLLGAQFLARDRQAPALLGGERDQYAARKRREHILQDLSLLHIR